MPWPRVYCNKDGWCQCDVVINCKTENLRERNDYSAVAKTGGNGGGRLFEATGAAIKVMALMFHFTQCRDYNPFHLTGTLEAQSKK